MFAPHQAAGAALIVPQAAPARLRETVQVWAATYGYIAGQTATATWSATTTCTATVTDETVNVPVRAAATARARTRPTSHLHSRHVSLTHTRVASPWDSVLEADDELLLLLD